jgi:hypothetical protein
MSEHLRANAERSNHQERSLEKLAAERLKHIERSSERQNGRRERVEKARDLIKQAEKHAPQQETAKHAEPVILRPILTRAVNYKQTLVSIQHRMKPAGRAFSRVIHNPTVERVSEVAEKTIMRPSISLGASTSAVIVTGSLYLLARYYGFSLRGSEIWISLIIGGILGLLIEALNKAIRRSSGHLG